MYILYNLEFIRNAKYSKALAHSDEIEIDHNMLFLKQYANNNISSPTKKYLVSKSNLQTQCELIDQELERDELDEGFSRNKS